MRSAIQHPSSYNHKAEKTQYMLYAIFVFCLSNCRPELLSSITKLKLFLFKPSLAEVKPFSSFPAFCMLRKLGTTSGRSPREADWLSNSPDLSLTKSLCKKFILSNGKLFANLHQLLNSYPIVRSQPTF